MRALALIVAAALLAGCQEGSAESEEPEAAVVEAIEGSQAHKLVLTDEAIQRLGIKTETVAAAAAGGQAVIPMTAVLYDPDGSTWTYTNPEPKTYVRQQVAIAKVENDRAILSSGPAAGTAVVVVGSAELLGTENGVGGG
ncbi:hypothetical protein [Lentzea nigeriaca]|uniref:hypothetical protein n=1 Tax=Lentzea nigeriaca TaxID=1128665 RepID=UPI001955F612|nr:hypothetical protein [Lentzea nigeriaca]MBM7857225.1 hypothetical protein [Lentzea nigeriaca]